MRLIYIAVFLLSPLLFLTGYAQGIPFQHITGQPVYMEPVFPGHQKSGNYLPISHYEADKLVNPPAFREVVVPVHQRYENLADDSLLVYGVVTFHRLFSAIDGQEIPYPTQSFTIDTISLGLGHENLSGNNDTLRLQLLALDTNGYPTQTIVWDSLYTSTQFGTANDWQTVSAVKFYCGKVLDPQQRVALKIRYYGSLTDTFGLVYGYREGGACAMGANNAEYSVSYPNSLAYWTGYDLQLPTSAGGDLYRDCNGNFQYDTITDGANFIQNWHVSLIASAPDLGTGPLTQKQVQIFPNPAAQHIYISGMLPGVQIKVADETGRIIRNMPYTEAGINISDLAPGIYYLIIQNEQQTYATKLLVAH